MALFAALEAAAFIVLCRKTVCADAAGAVAVSLFGAGLVAFFVQLVLFGMRHAYADYIVYTAAGVLYAGFIAGSVYCILLSRNSYGRLCLAAGALGFIPPLGAVLSAVLCTKIERDTPVQRLVYNGYAYTYGALDAYAKRNPPELVDASDEEPVTPLKPKAAKQLLKKLKKQATTPEDRFNYAVAILQYAPSGSREAVSNLVKAANADYTPALFNLGLCYETGEFVKKDVRRAKDCYKRAAAAGDEDAAMRLGIIAIEHGSKADGFEIFSIRAKGGDLLAMYNIAICCERGLGTERDVNKAIELYTHLASKGLLVAQRRLVSIACECFSHSEMTGTLKRIVGVDYFGTSDFEDVICGIEDIMLRRAADASKHFLGAVRLRGKWEGFARCIVGTLYIDSGEKPADRRNGVAYVRSALELTAIAEDIMATIPKRLERLGQK